jgi:hypothetical protein
MDRARPLSVGASIIRDMTSTHSYRYLGASGVDSGGRLGLATSGGRTAAGSRAHPWFFAGFQAQPEVTASASLAVANVARARYYQSPPAASRDPVVICVGDRLRFEPFSGCGGVDARLDVLSDALDGEVFDRGTTNIDVNAAPRESSARGPAPIRCTSRSAPTTWR